MEDGAKDGAKDGDQNKIELTARQISIINLIKANPRQKCNRLLHFWVLNLINGNLLLNLQLKKL